MSESTLINFVIDGMNHSVLKGTTVYEAAKKLGIEIPIFCYQDRMPPFGACRMCLVEVEKMNKLQTSCTLEVTEGMVVKTQSKIAEEGRKEILEFLLINHPLDCPICDRAGECPLQDNTMKYGPGLSRFFEQKRQFKKPLALSPVLMLDRERCITCARCTRFSDLISADNALEFIERGYRTEVGSPHGKAADSKFIGNTIMICPVGALTSNVYRFRARPWDNQSTHTTCTLCPVGCSMRVDSRDGEIMRTRSKENPSINDIWMCDKGWFGYEFSRHENRLQFPMIRREGKLEEASWDEALSLIAMKMQEAFPFKKIAGWGGNPLTTEENFLFQKFFKEGLGVNHVDHRIGMPICTLEEEVISPGMEIELKECEEVEVGVLLGLDLTEEFPVIWLRLKQAMNKGAEIIFSGHYAPEISLKLSKTILHKPGNELEKIDELFNSMGTRSISRGAIFIGRQYLNGPLRSVILEKCLHFKKEHPSFSINVMEGKENSLGASFAGMRPDLNPNNEILKQAERGKSVIEVVDAAVKEGWDILYVAGANPAAKMDSKTWKSFRSQTKFIVVQDLFLNETARDADVVLPTFCYVEKQGTFINIDGHLQKLEPCKHLPMGLLSDGEIFWRLANMLGVSLDIDHEFFKNLENKRMAVSKTNEMKNPVSKPIEPLEKGELYATFAPSLFDHGVRMRHNVHLFQLCKPPVFRIHPEEARKMGIENNEILRLGNESSCLTGEIQFDLGVAEKTIVLPLGFPEVPVYALGMNLWNGMKIKYDR